MESLLRKFKSMLGTYVEDSDGFYDEEEEYGYDNENSDNEYEERPALKIVPKKQEEEHTNLVKKPLRENCKHVDYRPHRFEDMENVVDSLCAGRAVILHLDGIDPRLCQRVLDFAAGVVCSMRCISSMPNDYTCILIPDDKEFFDVEVG